MFETAPPGSQTTFHIRDNAHNQRRIPTARSRFPTFVCLCVYIIPPGSHGTTTTTFHVRTRQTEEEKRHLRPAVLLYNFTCGASTHKISFTHSRNSGIRRGKMASMMTQRYATHHSVRGPPTHGLIIAHLWFA